MERANRTIREALKKTPGSVKSKLKGIIENYNNSVHRAIRMSPNEACKEENKEKVKQASNIYAMEFKG